MDEHQAARETASTEQFAAHWVSPHGGVRVFLGVGRDRTQARRVARLAAELNGLGFVRRARIQVTRGREALGSARAGPGHPADASARRAPP